MSYRYFAADFETAVYKGQAKTWVWSAAIADLDGDYYEQMSSIDEFLWKLYNMEGNVIVYFHNLKFDGSFILDWLLRSRKFKQALDGDKWLDAEQMSNNTYSYSISDMGQWYRLTIKRRRSLIEFRDSLKLLPLSLKRLAKDFGCDHQKLDMDYEGIRPPGYKPTEQEAAYIRNDVLALKEALLKFREDNKLKLTIGSCALDEYKRTISRHDYAELFPDLTKIELDANIYGAKTADKYIRNAYRGGWCYLKEGMSNKILGPGRTYDVNSLYPYQMEAKPYPVGAPRFGVGRLPDDIWADKSKYYYVRFKCSFRLRKGYLPTVQIKGSYLYRPNEWLKTSDFLGKDGRYYEYLYKPDGTYVSNVVTLTMSKTDFELFRDHYEIDNYQSLDYCYFTTQSSIFLCYIDKYRQIKENSTGATRTIAKLFSNNLYGKIAASDDSSYKLAKLDNGNVKFSYVFANDKRSGHIGAGAAITAYARDYTIRAAQANYADFVYADTDSCHLLYHGKDPINMKLDNKEYGAWKCEAEWERGIFVRQKTYIEQAGDEYDIKCAGMPDTCKALLAESFGGKLAHSDVVVDYGNKGFVDFINTPRTLKDFKIGLIVPGKLVLKRIKGGVILAESEYEMRKAGI